MNYKKISIFISLILRHKPEAINCKLDTKGWLSCDKLIYGIRNNFNINFTMNDLKRIVKEDTKQRYSFSEDKKYIRANQGHSLKYVNLDLQEVKPPNILFHGTCDRVVDSILKSGIKKMNRNYVHLSDDINIAKKVGKRHGNVVIFRINTEQMYEDGYKFYLSENRVWLTNFVPNKYIELIKK